MAPSRFSFKKALQVSFVVYLFLVAFVTWNWILGPQTLPINIDDWLANNPNSAIPAFEYDQAAGDWVERKRGGEALSLDSLTVATWNIWHGNRKENTEQIQYRMESVEKTFFEQVPQLPDVFAFQEITKGSLTYFAQSKLIQDNYWISDNPSKPRTFSGYGTVLFGRRHLDVSKLSLHTLPLSPIHRKILVANFGEGENKFCVAALHLESFPLDTFTREQQMKLVNYYNCSITMGDFNFATEAESNNVVESTIFHDVFKESQTPTINTQTNPLAYLLAQYEVHMNPQYADLFSVQTRRPDHILISTPRYQKYQSSIKFKVFGEKTFDTSTLRAEYDSSKKVFYTDKEWTPSDHYGLWLQIKK